jgi:hypothetical protein
MCSRTLLIERTREKAVAIRRDVAVRPGTPHSNQFGTMSSASTAAGRESAAIPGADRW